MQFGDRNDSVTQNKAAMPESSHFDGPSELKVGESQNSMAANSSTPLPKPGFSS